MYDIRDLRFESEGLKIKFGEAHFKAIEVSYTHGPQLVLDDYGHSGRGPQ